MRIQRHLRPYACGNLCRRQLRFEPLEDRRLLAAVTVNTTGDTVNFNDGLLSLREAIFATNVIAGADTIEFAASLTMNGPATIVLSQGELAISDSLTINGPGANLLSIDASGSDLTPDTKNGDGSRVFNVNDGVSTLSTVMISGLRLTGGDVTGTGGAISSEEILNITNSTLSGNASTSHGGAIFSSATMSIASTAINGNATNSFGGGIRQNGAALTITASTISNNTAGQGGGGISKGDTGGAVITGSEFRGNTAGQSGGGIRSLSTLTITSSIISDNSANDSGGGVVLLIQAGISTFSRVVVTNNHTTQLGGGISSVTEFGAQVVIANSFFKGNSADRFGGGLNLSNDNGMVSVINSTVTGNFAGLDAAGVNVSRNFVGSVTIAHSTIVFNQVNGATAMPESGAGLAVFGGPAPVFVNNSIIAENLDVVLAHDDIAVYDPPDRPPGDLRVSFSLIGANLGEPLTDNGGNLIGTAGSPIDPLLGPLADNGGPTMTHSLLAGSPAIDAGDPTFDPADPDGNPLTDDAVPFDQRGAPFGRMFDGNSNGSARIDIGAYESQPDGTLGDYNRDGGVNAADYVVWRKLFGSSVVPPFVGADGDGDSSIDPGDYDVWSENFGEVLPGSGGSGGSSDEGQRSRARVLSQALQSSSDETVAGAQRVMPVSERLAHVAASLRDADGRGTARRAGRESFTSPQRVPSNLTLSERVWGLWRHPAFAAWLAGRDEERGRALESDGDAFLGGERFELGSETAGEDVDAVFESLSDCGF